MDVSAAGVPIGLSARISNLTGILGNPTVLRIPPYQRPYTWTPVEVGALIEDLRLAFERGAPFYFIGHIVLVRNDRGELEIADGQQRLATLTMFLAYARDRLSAHAASLQALIMIGEDAAARPRLRLRRADEAFFLEHVQVPGGLQRMTARPDPPTDSQALMGHAVEAISEALDSTDDATLAKFVKFVCRCATFDVIIADERGGAATVFATMNTRGKSLSGPDIMKQELLERSGLSEAQADEAARTWEGLEDRLGRAVFAQLIGELMPVILNAEPIRSPGDLNLFRTAVLDRMRPQEFLREHLPRYGAALVALRTLSVDAGPASAVVNRRVHGLLQLPEQLWLAPAVAFLADHRRSPQQIARFFEALDALAFASFLKAIRAERREVRFARVVKYASDEAQLYAPGLALGLTEAERRELIDRINGSFTRDSGRRRIIALRLNAAIDGGEALSLEDDASVEHVLPVNPGAEWFDAFPNAARRRDYAHLLGNLVLLSADRNRLCGNKGYPAKRAIYFERGAATFALTRDIADITEWTPTVIRQRHERLTNVLIRDWGLLPGDPGEALAIR